MTILGPILFILAGIGLDRLVKLWTAANLTSASDVPMLPGLIHLTYLENRGAAFSMFHGQRWPLVVGTVLIMVLLVVALWKNFFPGSLTKWGCYCVISGAVGNFIDRVVYGYVVDMFNFQFITFPVFNVADVLICVGGGLWVLYLLLELINERKAKTNAEEDSHEA